ncbi:MAG TPA: tetratricopeptide repeat protein [Pirellulales bacterium]|nr:tetratricopeptide repeat protein [Pirellulales bacterium]
MSTQTKPVAADRAALATRPAPSRHRSRQEKRWELNVRLLAFSLAGAALLSPAVYAWHAYQVARNASALLDRAGEHEKQAAWMLAAQDLHRYLQLRPDDIEAMIRRAEDFDKGAKPGAEKQRALQLYAAALGEAPDRDDLKSRHMALQLELGNQRAALDEAASVLRKTPGDPAALRVTALAMHRQWSLRGSKSIDDVVRAYRTAIAKNPGDAELATGLARLYRVELQQPAQSDREALSKQADEVMNRLVAASDDKPAGLLARYVYRVTYNLPGGDADLDQAMVADPNKAHFEVWWRAGQRSLDAGEPAIAAKHFQAAVAADPTDRRGHLSLGNAYRADGKDDRAIEAWQAGLDQAAPGDIELQLLIATSRVVLQQWREATQSLDKAEKLIDLIVGPEQAELLSSVALLRAEVAKGEHQDFTRAISLLKQSLALRRAGAESTRRAAALALIETRLAECYAARSEWDQAALAYGRAADLQPRLPGPRLSAGRAWVIAGRYEEAVRQYDDALTQPNVSPTTYVALANAEYLRQMSLPSAQRDFSTLGDMLTKARQQMSQTESGPLTLLRLIEAEYDSEEGRIEQAIVAWHGLEKEIWADPQLVRRVAFDYERRGLTDESDRLLEQWKTNGADATAYLLLASEVHFRRKLADEAIRMLTEALPQADESAREQIESRLALMYLSDGRTDEARRLFESRAEADKRGDRPLHYLIELELHSADRDNPGELNEALRLIRELETREGPEGAAWRYYAAQRLLLQALAPGLQKSPNLKKLLQQAGDLQRQIEELRPNWPPGYLLKGRLTESATPPDAPAAIQAYARAIKLGEKNIAVYEAIILLLYRENRLAEADQYLAQLRQAVSVPPELATVAMAIDVSQGNIARAIEMARDHLRGAPDDALNHIRLGQLLAESGMADDAAGSARLAEAEIEIKKSRELAPDDARTWAALLTFYIQTKQSEAAAGLLDEVQGGDVLPSAEKAFFLAQGHAALGQRERAEAEYLKAIDAAPDRPAVQLQAASFFFQSHPKTAEKCLRRVLQDDPANRAASRLLAVLLSTGGGTEKELEEVWRLLGNDRDGQQLGSTDRRLKAILMLRRGGREYNRQAIELLESLADNSRDAAPIDRLLLARLYQAKGQMAEAREQLKTLVNSGPPVPDHLAAYVDNLLRSERAADAAAPLDELAKLEPESTHLRTLSLRARWLKDQNQAAAIDPLIEAFIAKQRPSLTEPADQAKLLQRVGGLYASLEIPEATERCYRQAVELDPAAHPTLAIWLNNQGRTSDAVQVCVKIAAADSTPLSAMVLSNVLAVGKPTDADRQLAEPVLKQAMERHDDSPGLLFCTATRHIMSGENDEAVRLLRQVLALDSKHRQAMNNLAMLLSFKPEGRSEAIQWIDRAIALSGSEPELLDSKAWILLQKREVTEAVDLLEEALANPPGDPRHQFHLALAYQLQGKLKEARTSLSRARQGGIDVKTLSPDERTQLATLEAALN